jgi:hypothetical protein
MKSSNHSFGSSFRIHYSFFVATNHKLSSVALDHRLTSHTAPLAFYTVACCPCQQRCCLLRYGGTCCHITAGRGDGVLTGLLRHSGKRCHVTAVGGGGAYRKHATICLITCNLSNLSINCRAISKRSSSVMLGMVSPNPHAGCHRVYQYCHTNCILFLSTY